MIKKEGTCQVTNSAQETLKERRIVMKDSRRYVKERKHQKFIREVKEES